MNRLLNWLFATILRGYPRAFRDQAEAGMLEAFRDGLQKRSVGLQKLRWGVRQLADAGWNLVLVWRDDVARFRHGRGRMGEGSSSGRRLGDALARAPLGEVGDDVRMAVRALLRRPGFAAFVGVTLALGIGANAAVFSVLHSVLLAPLPYEESERLVRMYWDSPGDEGPGYMVDPAFLDFREHLVSVEIAAINNYGDRDMGADMVLEGRAERVRVLRVSADYFQVLRPDHSGASLLHG